MTRPLAVVAALVVAAVARAAAQAPILPSTPRFQAIVELAQDGYGDSARTLVTRALAQIPPTDSLYPEALFTAGTIARTGAEMRGDFSRIVVEYPRSSWADKASLRLVQLAYGSGDMAQVVTRVGRMFTDYPDSPFLPGAALWGARAAFELQQLQQGCTWVAQGLAHVGDDIELRNQLLFAKQHCSVGNGVEVAPKNADSLRAGPPPNAPAPAPAPDTSATAPAPWRVQVIATASPSVVARLTKSLRAAGYTVYTIAGPRGLTKVQAGPFKSRADAAAAIGKIKKITGGQPFVANRN